MSDRSAVEQLKSLLGIWYTDSPTWPPAPGVQQAQKLLARVEQEHLESLAEYILTIKAVTGKTMAVTEAVKQFAAEGMIDADIAEAVLYHAAGVTS